MAPSLPATPFYIITRNLEKPIHGTSIPLLSTCTRPEKNPGKKIKGLLTDQWYATITNLQAHNALVPPAV